MSYFKAVMPAPLPKWARALLVYGPPVLAWLYDQLDYDFYDENAPMEWRRLQAVWTRDAPSPLADDVAVCTFDFLNITAAAPDATWTAGDFTTAETALDTMFTAIAASQANSHHLKEYRWYKRTFNPLTVEKPFPPSGAPVRVVSKSITGALAGQTAWQHAMSVTEKTPLARHWGRFYLPGVQGTSGLDQYGRFRSATITAIANAVGACYSTLATAELFPIVPVTSIEGQPARAVLVVTDVQVDDIPDVVRRRRTKVPAIRTIVHP